MKKVFFSLLSVLCFAVPAVWAQDLGEARYTDVVACINHYPIPSYNFNGYTLICAEDLEGYGFDVQWNPVYRTLQLDRSESNSISPISTFAPPQRLLNQTSFTVCTTDVRVYIGNYEIAALGGLPGKTLINIQDLACVGQTFVQWVPEVRAVKVWIEDGLDMLDAPWEIRELDPDMPLYRRCYYAEPHWSCVGTKDALFVCLAFRDADGYYAGCDAYKHIYIRDVRDANGNSRIKDWGVATSCSYSYTPYFLGLTDEKVSLCIAVTAEDLLPATAPEAWGYVDVSFYCSCGVSGVKATLPVQILPWE